MYVVYDYDTDTIKVDNVNSVEELHPLLDLTLSEEEAQQKYRYWDIYKDPLFQDIGMGVSVMMDGDDFVANMFTVWKELVKRSKVTKIMVTKVLVGLAEYTLSEYVDETAIYELTGSNTASFPDALYLSEPQGTILFASLPEFNYEIEEGEYRHICDLGHLNVYTSIGQEVSNFLWEAETQNIG